MDRKTPQPIVLTEPVVETVGGAEEQRGPSSSLVPVDAASDPSLDPAWRVRDRRYTPVKLIARGGMGEVARVRDEALGRFVAMKTMPWDVVDSHKAKQRFFYEMRTTAALQHPGIVPVHDSGELSDGRLWFTMKEVRGTTLRAAIQEMFAGTSDKWTLRRLIEVLARASEAVAYAHSREVVHRDIKPENLMIGEFGEVLVMDWGLVKNLRVRNEVVREQGAELDSIDSFDGADESLEGLRTLPGDVMGTPAYMSPEQARGELDRIGPASDVYALGAVLYEILCGQPPFVGSVRAVWRSVRDGQSPRPIEAYAGRPFAVPPELSALCKRAMAKSPDDRFTDAAKFGAEVRAWLDGAYRRDRALALVEEARQMLPKLDQLQQRARQLREEAKARLGTLKPYAAASAKAAGWALEDRAAQLQREAAIEEVGWFQRLQAALNEAPDLPEAHELLADRYRERLAAAEAARDVGAAAQLEALLRVHDRGKHAAFLNGAAKLSLVTEPAGAEVSLYRYVETSRILIPEYTGELGRTPLREMPVTKGSYVLRVRAPGYQELVYPVFLGRGEHWSGVAPGEAEPRPIPLLRQGELSPDEVYVPAGWFIAGGDPDAADSLPRTRLWANGLVVQRFPVTNGQYLEFLNDLVRAGRDEEAAAACPQPWFGGARSIVGAPVFERGEDGRYHLAVSAGPEADELRCPVVLIDWYGATRYAEWLAAMSGKPWRLLNELEWEKAARGVDGRLAPWGDHIDPTFACMLASHEGAATRAPVNRYPVDSSPYGVRGMAGNVRDWCINVWKAEGCLVKNGVLELDAAARGDDELRSARGGMWTTAPTFCRAAARFAASPSHRFGGVGFRLARPI